jgi:hypothetical protein
MKKQTILILVIALILFVFVLYYILPKLIKEKLTYKKILSILPPTVIELPYTTTPNLILPPSFPKSTSTTLQANQPEVKIEAKLSPDLISKIEKSEPGFVYSGVIKSINDNKITLDVMWLDPFNSVLKKNQVTITINPQDEVIKYKKQPDGRMEEVKISFKDLKVNDYILVSTTKDKKIITLLFSKITQP